MLPKDHRPFTDKYFLRTNEILKGEGLNPRVGMKITVNGSGKVAGLSRVVEVIQAYSSMRRTEVWYTRKKEFKPREPLLVIKAPVQEIVELETLYLGVLSDALGKANHMPSLDYWEVRKRVALLNEVLQVPITYFGARHYCWQHDADIARSALLGGAVQTSTDAGSMNINKEGTGTMPHLLVIVLAWKYGRAKATLKAAELFDRHIPAEVPRVILVDTFAKEITDSLAVAQFFGQRNHAVRIDTCPESLGEGSIGTAADPKYQTGKGLTIELVRNVKSALVRNGFGHTGIFLSGGFGNTEKARAFADANREFQKSHGMKLFDWVGIGVVAPCISATADVFEVEGKPLAKNGREGKVDFSAMEKLI